MKVTILIPARMAATRFPGKPLSKILGKPMIQWVYERASQSRADAVMVATDSPEIYSAVEAFGGRAMMTSKDHANGTQRIAEVAEQLETGLVINVQGDEPVISPEAINRVIDPLLEDPSLEMATLACHIKRHEDVFNPNIVKVVFAQNRKAMYFSRSPIPFRKHAGMKAIYWEPDSQIDHFQHIGVYEYQRNFLLRYVREPACDLENIEGLEQLRALYMGARIQVEIVDRPSIGVDNPEDIPLVERYLKEGCSS